MGQRQALLITGATPVTARAAEVDIRDNKEEVSLPDGLDTSERRGVPVKQKYWFFPVSQIKRTSLEGSTGWPPDPA